MKTSTSRDSGVKHATGNNDKKVKKHDRTHQRLRTSTGDKATINHLTGKLFDLKHQEEVQEKKPAKQKPSRAA